MPGKVVLIVEDNEQNMELATYLLEEASLQVRKAFDADEARREMAQVLPDLVLMDMSLAGVEGLSLVAEFRKLPKTDSIPMVALTAHAMRGDRERFLAGGCDGYIAKPIDAKTFVREVERFLAQGRAAPKGPQGAAP